MHKRKETTPVLYLLRPDWHPARHHNTASGKIKTYRPAKLRPGVDNVWEPGALLQGNDKKN